MTVSKRAARTHTTKVWSTTRKLSRAYITILFSEMTMTLATTHSNGFQSRPYPHSHPHPSITMAYTYTYTRIPQRIGTRSNCYYYYTSGWVRATTPINFICEYLYYNGWCFVDACIRPSPPAAQPKIPKIVEIVEDEQQAALDPYKRH